MRMIFVNLPVKDLKASMAFFEAIGFTNNPQFTDDTAACMVVDQNIFVMLLTHAKFEGFLTQPISDAHKTTEVLTCLSCASREEVDDTLAKALAAGARPWMPTFDMGPMHGASFQDPDGHVWELMYMDMSAMPPQA
ncbi:VOC family protein [Caulobacter sp. 17J80-11]|uniref:VOC family protein n=1 Tax=Caulobacter sp. 17J80-11 TaxID=2763502 RepID=UPI0016534BB5|nr:VOC family protein [Caulobacter sp. 17J80-11]MBC6982182.1 VOC family protein [Caulobacter sp. 17J80-11]